jgi:shikimate dehydrogenase
MKRTPIGAVLGWPVTHSRSPAMHNAAFAALGIDAAFVALAIPPESLHHAVAGLAAGRFLGASVTVPHKEAVLALCDRVEPLAARIGAVNCLVFDDGRVIGHNTDAGGFVDSLVEAGVDVAGRRAVLLGAGGAARAVHAGLVDAGAASVRVRARRPGAATWIAAAPWDGPLDDADLLVDCTPAALDPITEPAVNDTIALDTLPSDAVVISLVYHRRPLLLDRAVARGHVAVDGRGMLVHQGARAFQLWLGRRPPTDVMHAALSAGV